MREDEDLVNDENEEETPAEITEDTETVSDDEDTETFTKYTIYRQMVGIGESDDATNVIKKVEAFEKEAKLKFVEILSHRKRARSVSDPLASVSENRR